MFDLAHSLNIKAIILYEQDKFKEAEQNYLEALEVRKKIVADFGKQYSDRIAQILSNLGLLHCQTKKYELAEKEYLEAIEIYNQIITEYGLGRGGDIALTYLNLGYLNRCTMGKSHYLLPRINQHLQQII